MSITHNIAGLVRATGPAKAIEILLRRVLNVPGVVTANVQAQKLAVRPSDSDLFVLSQTFGWEEYRMDPERLFNLRKLAANWHATGYIPLIIDAGANVGYSALYFASLFPEARVLAIEPDRTSFEMLVRNTDRRPNIKAVCAALWSHDQGVELQTLGKGSWSIRVTEGLGTPSERLDVLVASIPRARPLIIKLDIEGAERVVIESCPELFAQAKCIMVEPHDFMHSGAACLSPLYKIAASKEFDTVISGENLLLFSVG